MDLCTEFPGSAANHDLRLGPLHYRFAAADAWGEQIAQGLAGYLTDQPEGELPDRLVRIGGAPIDSLGNGWSFSSSALGTVWYENTGKTALWSAGADLSLPAFRYQLPWALVLTDIACRGGAVVHAGLAVCNDRALLFMAPPGGGKSTTLATAPPNWEVLSDDAALIWPKDSLWLASPLPSWTAMTASGAPPAGTIFNPARQCRVAGMVILVKGPTVKLESLSAVAAATHTYRALSEYPSTVITDLPLKEHWFRTACAIARALPCRCLHLPLQGDIWPLLTNLCHETP